MTEQEAAFQAMLDANPADHGTRLVFADWLDEQGDPRGPGYRALGRLQLSSSRYRFRDGSTFCFPSPNAVDVLGSEIGGWLPLDWFKLVVPHHTFWTEDRRSRAESESEVALAFAKLPPERQQELLGLVTAEA